MTIENLYPFAGSHAVQNATFVLEWPDPLSESVIVEASKLGTKFKNLGFEFHNLQQQLEVKLEGQGTPQVQHRSSVGAIVFSREKDVTPTVRSISISRQNCTINIPDYTRWAAVFSDVEKYLKVVLDEVGPLRPINVIGLQYVDLFSWKDDPAELNLHEIFREDYFIPKNVFQQKNQWHLHHGYFEAHSEPLSHTLLENVNVDVLDTKGVRMIQVLGAHRASLKDAIWQSHMKNKASVLGMFSALHQANKEMLLKLFTPEVCKRISLSTS